MKCGIECLPLLTIQSTLHPRYVYECKQSTTKTVTHLLFSHFRIVIVFSEFLLAHCPFPKPQLHIINSLYVATMGMKKKQTETQLWLSHFDLCVAKIMQFAYFMGISDIEHLFEARSRTLWTLHSVHCVNPELLNRNENLDQVQWELNGKSRSVM